MGWISEDDRLLTYYEGAVYVTSLNEPAQSEIYRIYPPKQYGPSKTKTLRIRAGNQRFLEVDNRPYTMDMVFLNSISWLPRSTRTFTLENVPDFWHRPPYLRPPSERFPGLLLTLQGLTYLFLKIKRILRMVGQSIVTTFSPLL
ncbi:hypothetical protein Pan97_24900 [Bremerella volcania]|uniref:Uncharacterized protein n=1 Tax=Bremerella volcania TaxID=2527984 RepID=A0A518C898_9BACT|nr:hypothetical protein [Bremerella volcania]QDU75458.1 hypothetical protein Pan97_24900 [Bremerella volcania]